MRKPLAGHAHLVTLLVSAALVSACASASRDAKQPAGATTSIPPQASATAPPLPPANRLVSNDGTYLVLYRALPDPIPLNEVFGIEVRIFDQRRGQAPITDAELFVDAAMPEHRHGMNVEPRVWKQNDGSYLVSGMLLHMEGRWELYFDVQRKGVAERTQAEVWIE